MSESPLERARRAILRSSHRATGLDEFRADVDAALRPLVGWDVAAWSTTDPATLLFTSCVLIGMDEDHDAEQRLFELEFRADDVNRIRDLAPARVPAATLHAATGGDLSRSVRWRELLGALGVTDELRAVFRDREDCWGALAAYRFGGPPFTPADVDLLAALSPVIADGLRRGMLRDAAAEPPGLPAGSDAPGVLVADGSGAVAETTPQAAYWLAQITGASAVVPSVIRSVAAAARAAAAGRGDQPAQARLPRRDGGWLLLHGSALDPASPGVGDSAGSGAEPPSRVAVVIEPARQVHLADVMVRAYGLTAREREITEQVLQGRSTQDIAERLHISPYTVQDHLKSILAKADVSSRRDLVAELFGRHYAPATRGGALPSPYGWYNPSAASAASAASADPVQRVV
ncbi:helix-turn-helix domain-containing protein [Yinghuangia soli]|uniref:Helix-turn-helix transcriptional regulator n=1 Tax=Yinghuangia soli TaxID=2908204 RepID=A0AA41PTR9_9ACTN|nr:helix-turn-helix transcriptional regulator [Yinghuangia soli]MCF2525724.1 helix-turn-helix transcriptional regulator [Yinghuangia soli]